MPFTSGRYTATWNALALGQTADGFRISHSFMKRLITGDRHGDTVQDAVIRGMEVFAEARLIEFDAAAIQALINPYGTGYAMDQVGKLVVQNSYTKALVLTAAQINPGPLPLSQTLYQTILAENYPVQLLMAPDLREVPIRLRAYPSATGSFVAAA